MRNQTWQALDDLFSETPILKAEAVAPAEVTAAELESGIKLAEDYKEFVGRYVGAMVGVFPIYRSRRAIPMGNRKSFIEVAGLNWQ